ncbi:MAG: acyltransferase [Phaeodactylibacter sp.]|nr:acyltransferase [Phaeodactylibacter sp.]
MFLRHVYSEMRILLKREYEYYILKKKNPDCEFIRPFTVVNSDRLKLGSNVKIRRNCYFHCGGYEWSGCNGYIEVGEGSWFCENIVLYGAGGIRVGKCSGIGAGSMIFSSRDDYSREYALLPYIIHQFAEVVIGDYVRVFSNVIISPGVHIGDGAVIGAGSVVTRNIPPWTIAFGVPAKIVGQRLKDMPISEKLLSQKK